MHVVNAIHSIVEVSRLLTRVASGKAYYHDKVQSVSAGCCLFLLLLPDVACCGLLLPAASAAMSHRHQGHKCRVRGGHQVNSSSNNSSSNNSSNNKKNNKNKNNNNNSMVKFPKRLNYLNSKTFWGTLPYMHKNKW